MRNLINFTAFMVGFLFSVWALADAPVKCSKRKLSELLKAEETIERISGEFNEAQERIRELEEELRTFKDTDLAKCMEANESFSGQDKLLDKMRRGYYNCKDAVQKYITDPIALDYWTTKMESEFEKRD